MSRENVSLHPLKTAKYLWLGLLLCALVGGVCFLGGRWSAGQSGTTQIDAVVLQNQLTEIRELATVTYAYTNMAQFESSNDFYGVKIPFTTKSFILTYDGTIKAGVDLEAAQALNLRAWREPKLPGRYCPYSAARALMRAIFRAGGGICRE